MRYTSHNCWLLVLCGQVFRTWQTPMHTASSSKDIASSSKEFVSSSAPRESYLEQQLRTVSETARVPWALPKCDGGHLPYHEAIPSGKISSKFFSHTTNIKSQEFDCQSYFANLEEKDLATEEMGRMKEFLDEWSGLTTSSTLPTSPGLQRAEHSKDPTIAVQRIFTSLLHNKMSDENYGPWIDMFTYLIKADLNQQGLQPAIEHMLYGLQSLAIKHQGRADSHLTKNLEKLVNFLIEKLKAVHGSQHLGAWAQEILFPEMGLSPEMKNFDEFKEAVSYEPHISAFLTELRHTERLKNLIAGFGSRTIAASSARGGPHQVSEIQEINSEGFPKLEAFKSSSAVDDYTKALIMQNSLLHTPASRQLVLEENMYLLGKAFSDVVVLAYPEITDASAQTKTAVIMLLYHLALPSLEWTRGTPIPKWAVAELQGPEKEETPLAHISELLKKIRQELNIPSSSEQFNNHASSSGTASTMK